MRYLVLMVVLAASSAHAVGTSSRQAGWGCGDGGPAVESCIQPGGCTATATGLYCTDKHLHEIRKISYTDKYISRVVGSGVMGFSGDGGPAHLATLSGPGDVVVGPDGTIYISDSNNHRIRQVRNDIITTILGSGQDLPLLSPSGIAVGPDNMLYITDSRHRVVKTGPVPCSGLCPIFEVVAGVPGVSSAGTDGVVTFAELGDGGPATQAHLWYPTDVAFDGNILYIADYNDNRIRKVQNGIISTAVGTAMCYQSTTLCVSNADCPTPGDFCLVNKSGFVGNNGPVSRALLAAPGQIFIKDGVLYIADTFNNQVRKVANGIITAFFGNGQSFPTSRPQTGDPLTQPISKPIMISSYDGRTFFVGSAVDEVIWAVNMDNIPIATWLASVVTQEIYPLSFNARATWDSSVGATGYRVYIRRIPESYRTGIDVGNVLTDIFVLEKGPVWAFSVSAYNLAGESGLSNELTVQVLPDTPTRSPTNVFTATGTPGNTKTNTPINTPTHTRTMTRTVTETATATQTTTYSPLHIKTNTRTTKPTATAVDTPSPTIGLLTVSGRVVYLPNGSPMSGVDIGGSLTAADGSYSILVFPGATLRPRKVGDVNFLSSPQDAVQVLKKVAGQVGFTQWQNRSCDVTGNGNISSLDASRILQRSAGYDFKFPVTEMCNSDYIFSIDASAWPSICSVGVPINTNMVLNWVGVAYGDCSMN